LNKVERKKQELEAQNKKAQVQTMSEAEKEEYFFNEITRGEALVKTGNN